MVKVSPLNPQIVYMETLLHNNRILEYKRINEATDEILHYIDNRRKGNYDSLKTRWKKFNKLFSGGIEPNTLYTIAGRSGSGKSSFISSLESDLFECNPKANFVILEFSLEMLSSKVVGRKISYRLKKTTSELYSGHKTIDEEEYTKIQEAAEEIKKNEIYYVDIPGTVEEIKNTIFHFYNTIAKGKWLIIVLDHALLVKGRAGDAERGILADLQYMFIEIKKYGRNTIIQLSQLNRNIESIDRLNNSYLQFPMTSDLFGADSLFHASDFIIVLHRPDLLNLRSYGIDNWPTKNLIYMHVLKARDGELGIIAFENMLKYNRMEEHEFKKDDKSKIISPI
jgi:replicative DNA helicase